MAKWDGVPAHVVWAVSAGDCGSARAVLVLCVTRRWTVEPLDYES